MIRLDAITRKIEVVLAGAKTTNDCNCLVSYADATSTSYSGAEQTANSNGATPVTICSAPAAGPIRTIDAINVYNADTVTSTVTIRYNDNATVYPIIKAALLTGESLSYTHGSGWCALDANGNRKEVTASIFSSITVNGAATVKTLIDTAVTVAYSASMTFDASTGDLFEFTATDGNAFTINAPTNPTSGQVITLTVRNTSGGALGAATFNAVFKQATWTSPATANSRSITWKYNGTNWIEISRTTTDIPN